MVLGLFKTLDLSFAHHYFNLLELIGSNKVSSFGYGGHNTERERIDICENALLNNDQNKL